MPTCTVIIGSLSWESVSMVVHSRAVDEAFSGLHWLWARDLSPSACGLLQKAAQDLPVDFPQSKWSSRKKWQPTAVFLPRESCGQRSLVGCCPWGSHRVGHDWSDLACMHALGKEMATHSSILAWRIPGTEEPGGLPSVGSQSRTRLKQLSSRSSRANDQKRERGSRSKMEATVSWKWHIISPTIFC